MAMNPIIRAQLNEFMNSYPNEDIDDNTFFEIMSIFAVENGILGENNDPFKIHLRGCEFGIDGIAISVQGKVCIDADEASEALSVGRNQVGSFRMYQSKTSDRLDYGEVSKFLDAVVDFFKDVKLLHGEQIEELVGVRDEIFKAASRANPTLKCFFCTTGANELPSTIVNLIEANKIRLEELNIFGSVEISCIGAKKIQDAFRSATNSVEAAVHFPKNITLPPHDDVDEAYIGYVGADQILKMVLMAPDNPDERNINRTLFYDNVRDFNPKSEINSAILSDIERGDLSSFVFKNNGITVVAKNISRKGDIFRIEDYQIVNGCQTTNVLSMVSANLDRINVPFRLIGSSNPDFVSKIIIGTNRQNEVKEDQFWALLPFMKDLEIYCAGQSGDERILIERRENQYRDISIERTRIMKPSDLVKVAAAAFFYQPNRAARDYRGIRSEFSEKVFRSDHSVELYHLAALALYKFNYLIRTSRVPRRHAINKFYVLYALVRQFRQFPDLLDAGRKERNHTHKKIKSIITNNEDYILHIERVSGCIEELVNASGDKSREQVRDFIRTEAFSENFTSAFFYRYRDMKSKVLA